LREVYRVGYKNATERGGVDGLGVLDELGGVHLERLGELADRRRMRLFYPVVLEPEDCRWAEAGLMLLRFLCSRAAGS
jgi:hypothetical protein